jgi:hypothetical protein
MLKLHIYDKKLKKLLRKPLKQIFCIQIYLSYVKKLRVCCWFAYTKIANNSGKASRKILLGLFY